MSQLGRSALAVAGEMPEVRTMPAFDHGAALLEEFRQFRRETEEQNRRFRDAITGQIHDFREAVATDLAGIRQDVEVIKKLHAAA